MAKQEGRLFSWEASSAPRHKNIVDPLRKVGNFAADRLHSSINPQRVPTAWPQRRCWLPVRCRARRNRGMA